MKKIFLVLVLFISYSAFAQEKHLTIEDAVMAYYKGLVPTPLAQLQWIENTENFIYAENNHFIIKNSKTEELFQIPLEDFQKMNMGIKRLPYLEKVNKNEMLFQTVEGYTIFDYIVKEKKSSVQFVENAENQDFCFENKMLAYTVDNNLFITDETQKPKAITQIEDKNIVSGQSIHRNEFGIYKGTFWSPKGNYLTFYQKDETNVSSYPLEDITTYPSSLKNIKYPMAGQGSEKAKVGVYNIKTGKLLYLDINTDDEHYLTNLAWSPDEKFITLAEINRQQNHYDFNIYDSVTGKKVKTLFEESNEKWVEPENSALFLPNSNTSFLWLSEKDGFMNVYLYNLESNQSRQITDFRFVVTQILGFDSKVENVFVEATGEDPKGLQVFKINLKKGTVNKITKENGTHHAKLSSNGKYLLDFYTALNIPGKNQMIDIKTGKSDVLLELPNPLAGFKLGETEFIKLKAEDDQDLEAVLTKPANFDPTKKYPVLIYVYGGPHAQMVTDSWLGGTGLWMQYLAAEKDYIVFMLDNRGSANRGFKFESVIHRQQGIGPMKDQMVGLQYLKGLPYVDSDRIALNGWSYGGFMTISLLLNYPKDFKVGVAGGPVTDWKYYEVMYGERYMDSPLENPEGYEQTKLHNKIKNLKSDLLIIHGSIDDTVVPQHSLTLLKEAIENGVQLDFFTYPMHPHNVRGKDRVHLTTKMIDYILKHNN